MATQCTTWPTWHFTLDLLLQRRMRYRSTNWLIIIIITFFFEWLSYNCDFPPAQPLKQRGVRLGLLFYPFKVSQRGVFCGTVGKIQVVQILSSYPMKEYSDLRTEIIFKPSECSRLNGFIGKKSRDRLFLSLRMFVRSGRKSRPGHFELGLGWAWA